LEVRTSEDERLEGICLLKTRLDVVFSADGRMREGGGRGATFESGDGLDDSLDG
jgi:hypothetical protein